MHWKEEGSRGLLSSLTVNPTSVFSPTCISTLTAAWRFHFPSLSESCAGLIARHSHRISILPSQLPLLQLVCYSKKKKLTSLLLPLILFVFVSPPSMPFLSGLGISRDIAK